MDHLAELIVLLAVVGILFAMSTPFFSNYYRTAQVRGAASDIAAYLNQGRQLAIKQNTGVCLHITSTAVQYYVGSTVVGGQCTVTGLWTGPGTDSAGQIKVADGVTLTTASDLAFTYLGNAIPGTAITVTNTQSSQTVHVSVALSGRVNIGP